MKKEYKYGTSAPIFIKKKVQINRNRIPLKLGFFSHKKSTIFEQNKCKFFHKIALFFKILEHIVM